MSPATVLVFEDPTSTWFEQFQCELKHCRRSLSAALSKRTTRALRIEVSRDSKLRRNTQWNFVTLRDISTIVARQPDDCPTAVKAALICFTQLATFVRHTQAEHIDISESANLISIGSSIGVVAAAAISQSQNVQDLVEIIPNAIRTSYKIGTIADLKAEASHGKDASVNQRWAAISAEISKDRILKLLSGSTSTDPEEADLKSLRLSSTAAERLCYVSDPTEISSSVSEKSTGDNIRIITSYSGPITSEVHRAYSRDGNHPVDLVDITISQLDSAKHEKLGNHPIAIVGMAGRFPEAEDAEKFWQLLQAGKDVHRTIPADRFNAETHSDPTGKKKNTAKTPFGCFINSPGLFDPRFFNMSPKEAAQTDPAQRLMILTAYEALEMSGFVPNRTASSREDRVGTFYGQASDDWRETNSSQDIDTYFIPGGIRAFGPGRINYHLKFSGPSFSVDSACSSSFGAMNMACNSLWAGDCDTAITGGANILTNPDIFAGLSRGHFLSGTGSCKTFDADADGYCRADGVGTVILKRLEDAEADGDNVLGLIVGMGTNHSAHAISITHPHADTQKLLYQSILDNNGVDAHDVDYVEMHGTGTQAGDLNEFTSVSEVFAARGRQRREHPVYLGSAKSNVGHSEAAAGITSLIKVLMMLRKSSIPPHVGIKGTFNPALPSDLEQRNLKISLSGDDWSRRAVSEPRTAFLNNFSAAGGNTAMLLKEHIPKAINLSEDSRSKQIVTITAKTIRSMQLNIENLVRYIEQHPQTRVEDLSYTLTARRTAHSLRTSFTAGSLEEAKKQLQSISNESLAPFSAKIPGVIFTFTGQGALYVGIGKALFDTCTSFREDIKAYDSIAQSKGFPSFLPLISGPEQNIASLSPMIAQVGQVSVQLALARLWQSWGVKAKAVIGHSLGEYPALVIAGVLSASDMIYLVGRRAQLMENHCVPQSHGMVAVNDDADNIISATNGLAVEISCDNGPKMTVIGGPKEALETCMTRLEAKGMRCIKLEVLHAYHTAQVDPILSDLEAAAGRVKLSKPIIPILSPVLGRIIDAGADEIDPSYLCRHARDTVNFRQVLSSLKGQSEWVENSRWLEIGPQPTCIKFVQRSLGPKTTVANSLEKGCEDWTTLSDTVCQFHDRGFSIDWEEFHHGFENCHRLLDLPTYAWDLKNFWIDYRHDWSLTKGDAPIKQIEAVPAPVKSSLCTTSIHRVIKEEVSKNGAYILTETDFSDPILQKKASGHKVNGTALCPSSIYADMALTVAEHLHHLMCPDGDKMAMDVYDMSIDKPFIVEQSAKVSFHVEGSTTGENVQLEFFTVSKTDKSQKTRHANCSVKFAPVEKWLSKSQRSAYLMKERIASLERASQIGAAHRMQRNIVYRLFSSFVEYDDDFQGIEDVILDSPQLEARAKVVLKPVEKAASFHTPPTWIDSLCHLTGAILTSSDAAEPDKYVYISHRWKSMRFLETLKESATYHTYVRMQDMGQNFMEGDVWIFDGDKVVGVVKGIQFQRIPRKVINVLLPPPGAKVAAAAPKATASKPAPAVQQERVVKPQQVGQLSPPVVTFEGGPASDGLAAVNEVLELISQECGVDPSELVDNCSFTSLGIDSLLSLEILARLREDFGIDLRPHVFLENDTVGELKAHLTELMGGANKIETAATSRAHTPALVGSECSTPSMGSTKSEEDDESIMDIAIEDDSRPSSEAEIELVAQVVAKQPPPKAVSYLLSGSPKTASKFLFLFPDGSGSATSYATMPPLGSDVAAFGLNCPYMTTPQAWRDGIASVTQLYVAEVRRRQPRGPYNFAGWSAGGILAYSAAHELQRQGEAVQRLVLIDSPCPVALPPMPVKMFKFLDHIGMLGNASGTPDWVVPHFEATVANLDGYAPPPFAPGAEPTTTTIWARHGVTRESGGRRPERSPDDPAVMEWLLQDRVDFGPNGWDQLIHPDSIVAEVMDGHHFSMTKDHANELGRLVAKAMQ